MARLRVRPKECVLSLCAGAHIRSGEHAAASDRVSSDDYWFLGRIGRKGTERFFSPMLEYQRNRLT